MTVQPAATKISNHQLEKRVLNFTGEMIHALRDVEIFPHHQEIIQLIAEAIAECFFADE